jgi:inosine/xanthosine triphosphatase
MSDKESITGARNRAKKALESLGADYGVGLEGGLQEIEGNWFDAGWIVVVDKEGNEGIGSTIRMMTPEKMMDLIKQGMELGHVNDKLFGLENSKHGDGHFGLMTNGAITRTDGYRDGVIAALARFIKPEVF